MDCMRLSCIVTCVIVAGLALPALAAPLDQESLVRRALAGRPTLAAASESVLANQERAAAPRAARGPQFTVGSGLTYGTSGSGTQLTSDPYSAGTLTFSAHQELLNPGREAEIAAADAATLQAEAQRTALASQIAYGVRQAYLHWLEARELERSALAQRDAARAVRDQAAALFRAGERARLDLTRAQAALSAAEAGWITARTATRQAQALLEASLGSPVEGEPVPPATPSIAARPLGAWLAELPRHPALLLSEAKESQAEAQADQSDRQSWPTLSADGSLGLRSRDLTGGANWQLGLSAAMPVMSGQLEHQRAAAWAVARAARADREDQASQLRSGMIRAYLDLESARERLPATQASLASARENLAQARGRYQSGVGAILEVSDAQNVLASAEADAVHVRVAFFLALAGLYQAAGLTGVEP